VTGWRGDLPRLVQKVKEVDAEMRKLEHMLTAARPLNLKIRTKEMMHLRSTLDGGGVPGNDRPPLELLSGPSMSCTT
jgi:hypothetical protein